METKNTKPSNPPAFPNNEDAIDSYGMTLRGYFANSAMQGIMSNPNMFGSKTMFNDDISSLAYELADAMLKQREL